MLNAASSSGIVSRIRNFSPVLALLFGVLSLTFAAFHRFVLDDAFISFRYARHLAEGKGLVWNADGTTVEGYTNFLWTVLLSLSYPAGIDVVLFSQLLGIASAAGTLYFLYRSLRAIVDDPLIAVTGVLLLAANYTYAAYMTSGLETQLQTFLLTALFFQATSFAENGRSSKRQLLLIAVLISAALMTRLDSAVAAGIIGLAVLRAHVQTAHSGKKISAGWLIVPVAVIIGGWLFWKLSFYGNILPNTFYVRTSGVPAQPGGMMYLYRFFDSYLLIPALLLILTMYADTLKDRRTLLAFVILIFWWSYVASVGGDFMEFRFFVPTLPLLIVLIAVMLSAVTDVRIRIAVVAMLLFGSILHARMFRSAEGIESIATLRHWIHEQQWEAVGKKFDTLFAAQRQNVRIAVRPAGAIPYYSQLPTLDMLGLNDPWIARNGIILNPASPGHQRAAPFRYIMEQNVDLLIGHPLVARRQFAAPERYQPNVVSYFAIEDFETRRLPAHAAVVEIPLDSVWKISVVYLTKNPFIDSVIVRNHLKTIPFIR